MELIIAAVLAGIGVAVAAVGLGGDARRTRRVLRKARVVPIAKLVDGQLACIVGRIEADAPPIQSLMTQEECVAFDTTTKALSELSVSVTTTRRAVTFFVVDDTGRARVDAPQVALCNRVSARSDRYEERMLRVGQRVRLVGSVVLDPMRQTTAEHGYREGQWKATIVGTAKFPLLADSD